MNDPLRVLILEDRADDAEMMLHALRKSGFTPDWGRVATESDYAAHLSPELDLILADFNLPQFDAPRALAILQERDLDIPFIVVSGSISEETAVECMKRGAADYLLKDRLERLGEAVKKALRERAIRDEKRQMEAALAASEEQFRMVVETAPMVIMTIDEEGRIIQANPQTATLFGYTPEEVIGQPIDMLVPLELSGSHPRRQRHSVQHPDIFLMNQGRDPVGVRRDGSRFPVEVILSLMQIHGRTLSVALISDITERKAAEQRIQRLLEQQISVNNLALGLGNTTDPNEIYSLIREQVCELMDASTVAVSLFDHQEKLIRASYVVAQSHVLDVSEFPPIPLEPEGQGIQSRVIRSGEPLYIADLRKVLNNTHVEYTVYDKWVVTSGPPLEGSEQVARSALFAPMKIKGKTIGVLQVQSFELDAYSQDDLDLLSALANVAAVAIQNARLYNELETYSGFLAQAVKDRTVEIETVKDRLQSILDNSPDPILLLDRYGAVETANPAFFRLFHTDRDEIRRHPIPDLVIPAHQEAVRYLLHQVMVRRHTERLEVTAQRLDATTFEADMALALIRQDNRIKGAVCLLRDITRLKEVERLKDEFVSNVSHELRTPITSIKLSHDLILRDPAKQEVYLGRLKREIDRLSNLIEDLLRLSRLDQGRVELHLEQIDLNDLVSQYVNDRIPLADGRKIALTAKLMRGKCYVKADKGLLGQVLSILLTNAINYTPEGGTVVIQTRKRKDRLGHWAGFCAKDTGPGIPADEQSRLFERFFRGNAGHSSGAPGTGLGLAIAREIIEKHKGTIEVASEGIPGQGATFTVWLAAETLFGSRTSGKRRQQRNA